MDHSYDPMGSAIADFWRHGVAGRLRVFSPDFDEDEIPVESLFRTFDEMPPLERRALQMASGRILDVGAGAGCHTLALQTMDKDVTAVEISALSVATMRDEGVKQVLEQDFFTLEIDASCEELAHPFDTILMLMNGIGIVGTLDRLPQLFERFNRLLAPGGQVLLDSTDLCYLFEEDGVIEIPEGDRYYGELEYQMQYKRIKGQPFPWLYLDPETLTAEAARHGYHAEIVAQGDNYDFLARLTHL